jgi:hypothetical protein
MNDDIRRALEEAGRRNVPQPRAGFATELEARLMAVAETAPPPPEHTPTRRRSVLGLAASLVAVAVVLTAALAILGRDDRSGVAYELTDPVNVVVVLSDGTRLVDPDGLLLPDGAVVQVGVDGSARIGESVLAAGDTATVDARQLRIDRQPRSAVVSPGPTRTPAPTPAPSTGSPSPTSTSQPSSGPTATTRPDSSPSPTPSPTRPPAGSTPKATLPPASDSIPSSSPATDVPHLRLKARVVGPAEIQVTWKRIPGAHRYILIATRSRSGPAAKPTYPDSLIIGRFTRAPTEPLSFTVKDAIVEIRLRVVALSADGSALTRSRIVTLTFPR